MMEIAGVADFANMEGMLCACMCLFIHATTEQLKEYHNGVAELLKELAQQDTYCGDIRDKFE